MHLAFKKSTPKHIRLMFQKLANQEIKGSIMPRDVPDAIPIAMRTRKEPAIDRLKNYSKSNINMTQVDGMFTSTFTPSDECEDDCNLGEMWEDTLTNMVTSVQGNTTVASDAIFEQSVIINSVKSTPACDSRKSLKPLIDTAFALADRIGNEGCQKLEKTLLDYHNWAKGELQTVDDRVIAFLEDKSLLGLGC